MLGTLKFFSQRLIQAVLMLTFLDNSYCVRFFSCLNSFNLSANLFILTPYLNKYIPNGNKTLDIYQMVNI